MTPSPSGYRTLWPMVAYFSLAVLLAAVMLLLSYVLGQRHNERQTDKIYEGGIESTGTAQLRFSVKFYLVAVFFVVFDLESVFIFSWAVAIRETGWTGFAEAFIFIIVLMAALVYLWKLGALDVGPKRAILKKSSLREGVSDK